MGETKIKIDLKQGTIEAEGSEELVRLIYADFKEQLRVPISTPRSGKVRSKTDAKVEEKVTPTEKRRKTRSAKPTPQLIKDLDLSGEGEKPSLKEFYSRYAAKTNFEKNLIFCYYLEHMIEKTPITVDHVFTCYRHIPSIKAPKALAQSLLDTAHHKGWVDTSSLENIKVPIAGMNHLEHDLAKAESK